MQTLTAKTAPATTGLFDAIASFFGIFGAAIKASAAVENGRTPKAADLRTLGIDPKAFARA